MNKRLSFFAAACGGAALMVFEWTQAPPAPQRQAVPTHGLFGARLQPTPGNIGSVHQLTPIALGDRGPSTAVPASMRGHHEAGSRP